MRFSSRTSDQSNTVASIALHGLLLALPSAVMPRQFARDDRAELTNCYAPKISRVHATIISFSLVSWNQLLLSYVCKSGVRVVRNLINFKDSCLCLWCSNSAVHNVE